MQKESVTEVQKLIELTEKFIDFANKLLDEDRITEEQYEKITKQKVLFLQEVNKKVVNQ